MNFRITILGSSGALPAYGRFPSSQLVEIQNQYFLVDCGEGVQMQLMHYQINFHRINRIFISHLHGDHYLGLMGLIFTMHLQRRTNELHIYSHGGLDDIITTHFRHSNSVPAFNIVFHHLPKNVREVIYEDEVLSIETIPLIHKIRCSGFLFREKPKLRRIDKVRLPEGLLIRQLADLKRGYDVTDDEGNVLFRNTDLTFPPRKSRSFAYCSDTAFNEKMVKQIEGVDVLYHESTFTEDEIMKATETLHSTAIQAASIARMAGVDRLYLGHFSARYKDLAPILSEAKTVFENSYLATEGEQICIED